MCAGTGRGQSLKLVAGSYLKIKGCIKLLVQNFICWLYFYVIFLLTCDILVTLGVAQYFSVFLFCGSFRVSCCGSNPKSIRAVFHFLFWWKFTGSSIQFVIFEWMAASYKVGWESHWRWRYQCKTNKYR